MDYAREKLLLCGVVGLVIGSFAMAAIADHHVRVQAKTVTCVEHVTVDNDTECALFEWRGQIYATEFATIKESK
jgi:hypothetical protein